MKTMKKFEISLYLLQLF